MLKTRKHMLTKQSPHRRTVHDVDNLQQHLSDAGLDLRQVARRWSMRWRPPPPAQHPPREHDPRPQTSSETSQEFQRAVPGSILDVNVHARSGLQNAVRSTSPECCAVRAHSLHSTGCLMHEHAACWAAVLPPASALLREGCLSRCQQPSQLAWTQAPPAAHAGS